MRSDWLFIKLGEICPLLYGRSLPARSRVQGEFPVVSSAGIIDSNNSYCVEGPGVVIGRKGTVGSLFYVGCNFWPIDTAFYIQEDNKKYCLRYIYYMLHTLGLPNMNFDAAVPGLNRSSVHQLEIPLPPLPEQCRIAALLGALDDKIELNRKMNQTLEEMAQAIFKSCFVDFDGVPEEEMVESELGLIPRGWEVGNISHFSTLNPESWKMSTHPKTIEYVDLSNTNWGVINQTTTYTWSDAPSRARRVLREGDTIVGCVRPGNGAYALIHKNGLTGSTGFAVLHPKEYHFAEFVYLATTRREHIEHLAHLADGGAYPAIKPNVVMEQELPIPPNSYMSKFSRMTSNLLQRINQNRIQSQTLAELRDTLLPKLISGELRIPEAEEQVTDALS